MRKVVSNTTPILSLLKIGKLDVLRHLYGKVMIPQAVYREIEAALCCPAKHSDNRNNRCFAKSEGTGAYYFCCSSFAGIA